MLFDFQQSAVVRQPSQPVKQSLVALSVPHNSCYKVLPAATGVPVVFCGNKYLEFVLPDSGSTGICYSLYNS